jgi:hypothetical protein
MCCLLPSLESEISAERELAEYCCPTSQGKDWLRLKEQPNLSVRFPPSQLFRPVSVAATGDNLRIPCNEAFSFLPIQRTRDLRHELLGSTSCAKEAEISQANASSRCILARHLKIATGFVWETTTKFKYSVHPKQGCSWRMLHPPTIRTNVADVSFISVATTGDNLSIPCNEAFLFR